MDAHEAAQMHQNFSQQLLQDHIAACSLPEHNLISVREAALLRRRVISVRKPITDQQVHLPPQISNNIITKTLRSFQGAQMSNKSRFTLTKASSFS